MNYNIVVTLLYTLYASNLSVVTDSLCFFNCDYRLTIVRVVTITIW